MGTDGRGGCESGGPLLWPAAACAAARRKLYQRQIDATDEEIDALVRGLYGLTEEEIEIVERANR
jgi:hypothetical protein